MDTAKGLAIVVTLALATAAGGEGVAGGANTMSKGEERMIREPTEWVQMDVLSATSTNLPRVLLVGDSITAQYFGPVFERLEGRAYVAKFATSACVADPLFHKQLEAMFLGYEYAVIHFNNGLHGIAYTEAEYEAGYRKALAFICEHAPSAKLVLALTTPVCASNDQGQFNPRVVARNAIVTNLAATCNAGIDDLYTISVEHPDNYADSHHYKKEGIDLQAAQVAGLVTAVLDGSPSPGPSR